MTKERCLDRPLKKEKDRSGPRLERSNNFGKMPKIETKRSKILQMKLLTTLTNSLTSKDKPRRDKCSEMTLWELIIEQSTRLISFRQLRGARLKSI